jgi:hypothetical protein
MPIFINVSNHPSRRWESDQLLAARDGDRTIVDIAFPQVDPQWDAIQVDACAQGLCLRLAAYIPKTWETLEGETYTESVDRVRLENVVHIMGESGLLYATVKRLLSKHFQHRHAPFSVVHSTTEREVVEEADGTKRSTFRFLQFRQYL